MGVCFSHETFLVYKLETFTNCKEVKHIMIMIIVIIYIFFILCNIWLTVDNYLQKILSPPIIYVIHIIYMQFHKISASLIKLIKIIQAVFDLT